MKRKALKKELNEELMPVAWHPKRWWDWCLPEDEKKDILLNNTFNESVVYNMEVLEHFGTGNSA